MGTVDERINSIEDRLADLKTDLRDGFSTLRASIDCMQTKQRAADIAIAQLQEQVKQHSKISGAIISGVIAAIISAGVAALQLYGGK